MTNNSRVFNVTRRFSMKHKQAVKAVENCACAWVEFGVSVRDLTLQESIKARHEQAIKREPLALAEIPGLVFRAAPGREASTRVSRLTATEANQFARLAAASA